MKSILLLSLMLSIVTGCGEQASDENFSDSSNSQDSGVGSEDIKEDIDSIDLSNLDVLPSEFKSAIENPYFLIEPGAKFSYTGTKADQKFDYEILETSEVKEINGIETQGVWEREWLDDILVKDLKRWYAEDMKGNVWLLGEDEKQIYGGHLKNSLTWEAESDQAKAGVIIPGEPEIGEEFRVSFDGLKEVSAEIIALNEAVGTTFQEFSDCIRVEEEIGDATVSDQKFYCKDIGGFAKSQNSDLSSRLQLNQVQYNQQVLGFNYDYPVYEVLVTEEQAKGIAEDMVADFDKIDSIEITLRNGVPVYVVNVEDNSEDLFEVIIDIKSGNVKDVNRL